MYHLNMKTCTVRDVIQRSIVCHPTTLIESLERAAQIHNAAYAEMTDGPAKVAANSLVHGNLDAARLIADKSEKSAVDWIMTGFVSTNCAFLQAAKLQLIPRGEWSAILERAEPNTDGFTRAQIETLHRKYAENSDAAASFPEFCARFAKHGDYIGGQWCGMFLGIESDGYAHT